MPKNEVSVEPLKLKHKPKKRYDETEDKFRRTVQNDHGYPRVSFPKSFIEIGLKLNAEVVVEKRGNNPLQWEIVIKPSRKSPVNKPEQSDSHG